MGFVTWPKDAQYLHRLFHRRLFQVDRLETPFQGCVLLDVPPVFVGGSCADALQLAPGQGRLEQVAGVDPTLGGPGSHHGVNLVQEENDLPLGLFDLVHHGLQPFFKLTAEFGARDEAAHVQGQHPAVFQRVGNVSGDDASGQSLGNGCFTNSGFSDDGRVVLLPAAQRLHHLPDFIVPAHHGV